METTSELKKQLEENQNVEEHDMQKGKYMTFKSGNEYFGLKIQYVNEIIGFQEITVIPETEDYIKGLINLRGKIIPVIDVRLRFKQPPFEYNDRTCCYQRKIYNCRTDCRENCRGSGNSGRKYFAASINRAC